MHAETRIVSKDGQAAGACRGQRLDRGVLLEGHAGLVGSGQAEVACRDDLDTERSQHGANLARLAAVVGGHDQLGQGEATRHYDLPIASRCSRASSPTPFLASAISSRNCVSLKGLSSAVPWTSTMPPSPVSTKLASAWAFESSG